MNRTSSPPPPGTVVVADRQSRGRGREGRKWLSPEGGLYLSILKRCHSATLPHCNSNAGDVAKWQSDEMSNAGGVAMLQSDTMLPLVAGLAISDLAAAHGIPVAIKWPNDVLVLPSGRKLAGVLCEKRDDVIAIGIGINLVDAPIETAASFQEFLGERLPSRDDLLQALLEKLSARLKRSDTASEVEKRLYGRGASALHNGRQIIISGIAANGALIASTPDDPRAKTEIISGEVTFL